MVDGTRTVPRGVVDPIGERDGDTLTGRTTGGACDAPVHDTSGIRASTRRRTTGGTLDSALLAGDRLVMKTGAPAGAPQFRADHVFRRPTTDPARSTKNNGVAEPRRGPRHPRAEWSRRCQSAPEWTRAARAITLPRRAVCFRRTGCADSGARTLEPWSELPRRARRA
jgi:hypothetical protein